MSPAKPQKSSTRNIDLIDTYYSGSKTPWASGKKSSILDNITSNKLPLGIITAVFIIAGVIIIGHSASTRKSTAIDVGKAVSSLAVKQIPEGVHYSLEQISDNIRSIILDKANSSAVINLGKSLDLSDAVISFGARGESGDERIALILKDSKKLSNANPDDVILTTPLKKDVWGFFRVRLKDISIPVDKSRVTQIRFDNSFRLTKNDPGSKVYIKDIIIK